MYFGTTHDQKKMLYTGQLQETEQHSGSSNKMQFGLSASPQPSWKAAKPNKTYLHGMKFVAQELPQFDSVNEKQTVTACRT